MATNTKPQYPAQRPAPTAPTRKGMSEMAKLMHQRSTSPRVKTAAKGK